MSKGPGEDLLNSITPASVLEWAEGKAKFRPDQLVGSIGITHPDINIRVGAAFAFLEEQGDIEWHQDPLTAEKYWLLINS